MTPSTLVIRSFEDRDEPGVIDLWRVCFPHDPPRNEPRRVIERKRLVQRELFLVGLLDGGVVCTVLAGFDGVRGWVYHLATAPRCRRRGFARRLMEEAERRLANLGCTKLNLQVRASNDSVVEFYESLGYEIEDRVSLGKVIGEGAG